MVKEQSDDKNKKDEPIVPPVIGQAYNGFDNALATNNLANDVSAADLQDM